jgi:hypothetical protein
LLNTLIHETNSQVEDFPKVANAIRIEFVKELDQVVDKMIDSKYYWCQVFKRSEGFFNMNRIRLINYVIRWQVLREIKQLIWGEVSQISVHFKLKVR